jgi:hypothetical protein
VNLLFVVAIMVSVFASVMWLGSIWIAGAEAYDDPE